MITKHQLVTQWKIASDRLERVKAQEKILRLQIATVIFPDAVRGSNFNDIYHLKLIAKQTINLRSGVTAEELQKTFDRILSKYPDTNLAELINWTPSLDKETYAYLTNEVRAMLAFIIEKKDAMPTLEQIDR